MKTMTLKLQHRLAPALSVGAAVSMLALLVGCGAAMAPAELVNARAAYQTASTGEAAQLSRAQVLRARTALIQAEKAYRDGAPDAEVRDFAYIALRQAQAADAQADSIKAIAAKDKAASDLRIAQMHLRSDLQKTQDELAAERQRSMWTKERLAEEERAHAAAEEKARLTQMELEKFANVKQEPRGVVLTLSGAVLFASGKSKLLPTANAKLDEVARVLAQSDQKIAIEGYTDSRGKIKFNKTLSQKRAASVRNYLVAQGVPAGRIIATGMGPQNPIADNTSAEGRANNRRVEIIVQPMMPIPAAPATPATPKPKDYDLDK